MQYFQRKRGIAVLLITIFSLLFIFNFSVVGGSLINETAITFSGKSLNGNTITVNKSDVYKTFTVTVPLNTRIRNANAEIVFKRVYDTNYTQYLKVISTDDFSANSSFNAEVSVPYFAYADDWQLDSVKIFSNSAEEQVTPSAITPLTVYNDQSKYPLPEINIVTDTVYLNNDDTTGPVNSIVATIYNFLNEFDRTPAVSLNIYDSNLSNSDDTYYLGNTHINSSNLDKQTMKLSLAFDPLQFLASGTYNTGNFIVELWESPIIKNSFSTWKTSFIVESNKVNGFTTLNFINLPPEKPLVKKYYLTTTKDSADIEFRPQSFDTQAIILENTNVDESNLPEGDSLDNYVLSYDFYYADLLKVLNPNNKTYFKQKVKLIDGDTNIIDIYSVDEVGNQSIPVSVAVYRGLAPDYSIKSVAVSKDRKSITITVQNEGNLLALDTNGKPANIKVGLFAPNASKPYYVRTIKGGIKPNSFYTFTIKPTLKSGIIMIDCDKEIEESFEVNNSYTYKLQ